MGKYLLPALLTGAAILAIPTTEANAACIGNCGALGPDGVVTASPAGSVYNYISTDGGAYFVGQIGAVGGTNGSLLTIPTFSATAGQELSFYFNYVTADGGIYSDYAWAELETVTGAHVAWLATARATDTGNTAPGGELPTVDASLTPATTIVNAGPPFWAPLGSESQGQCFDEGCGSTGWIGSAYEITNAGNYKVVFGVTNWGDADPTYNSGLAFNGLTLNGSILPVPETSTWAMLILGFLGLGLGVYRKRASV